MNILQTTNSLTTKTRQVVTVVIVVLSVFLLERVGWAALLRERTLQTFKPIVAFGMHSATVLEFPFYLLENEQRSAAEIHDLKRSYAYALARVSELETLEKENQALRALISETKGTQQKKRLAAPVLSYALTGISLGSNDGVAEGALVYISDVLVGRVVEVSQSQSRVMLFSARESDPILVQTASGVQGLLVGSGKRAEVTQIPIQAVVQPGERLTTVGQLGVPPGQFVGLVASVSQPATAPMQTAVVDQLQSFYSASLVEIR